MISGGLEERVLAWLGPHSLGEVAMHMRCLSHLTWAALKATAFLAP